MPFKHKLSCRLALLKDLVWLIPIVAGACQLPDRRTGPSTARLSRLALSPPSALVRVNQNTDVTVVGLTASGDTAPIAITFRVRGSAGGSITGTTDAGHREIAHYQAAATAGQDSVIASDTSGLADTSVVVVTLMPVASVAVAPTSASVFLGETAPFTATLRDSTGTTLTGRVITWTSNNPAVATVSTTGVATAVTLGSAAIVASSEGKSDTALMTVVNVPVASVTVTPPSATVAVGVTTPFTATMRDSAGAVLTGRVVTWSSTNLAVATVTSAGVARGVAAGSASIIATSEGRADTSSLTVIVIPVASVTVTPPSATIAVGGTASFTATTRDSTGAALTGRVVTWASTNAAIATVSATGVATGVAAGSASIIATSEGKADTSSLTVIVVPVASVTVTPPSATIAVAATVPFTATTRDSAGGLLTGRVVTWASTNAAVASVSASGVATGVGVGSAAIIASSEGKADTSVVTVIVVPVASVTVTPATATVQVGLTTPFTATTRDSAGGLLTGRVVTWSSTNAAAATVSATGVATGVAAGSTSIIASSEGKADTAALTVVAIPPPGAVPDPTLLPVANGQAPNNAAYTALNLPSRPAGYSYNDPVTGVRIWKVTSSTVPVNNATGIGHDYADGGNQVSLGWGPNNNTHTILLLPNGLGGNYHIVDFTRGVGFSNYRRLTVQPKGDLAATFSNLPSQPRILYIMTSSQLVRYNTATMQVENTGFFPLAITADAWLHQDKDDVRFVATNYGTHTGYVWNSQTNQLLSHAEPWMDEVRMERNGRYAVFTGVTTVRVWDLSNNTFGTVQTNNLFWFGHIASLRGRWVTEDPNIAIPYATDRYDINGTQITRTGVFSSGMGNLANYSGNWVQSDAELGGNMNKQWACGVGWGADAPSFAWRQAIGFVRADGSDQRLLLHHYSSNNPSYYATPWGTPSPDGKVVIFNSNMRGSGRYDTFVAEVPLR